MVKKKMSVKLLSKVFLILTTCLLFVGCSDGGDSTFSMETYRYEGAEGAEPVSVKKGDLELTMDPDTTWIEVKDARTGTVWRSNPSGLENDAIATGDAVNLLHSTMTVKYTTVNDVSNTFNNYQYSIQGKQYTFAPFEEDGQVGIEVNYTLGEVERAYLLPLAVPESRMNEIAKDVDDKGMKDIANYYRKVSLDNLRAGEDASTFKEQYPAIESEAMYILREGLKDHLKKQLEEMFVGVGYTQEDYNADLANINVDMGTDKPGFNVTVRYCLDDEGFFVEVPMEKIVFNDTYPIIELSVLPYFGAGGLEDEGFLFVPDGNGGVINFNNKKRNQATFTNNVYGWDYGVYRDALIEDTTSSYPVFGISNNGKSFLCVSEKGSSYAYVEADISEKLTSYNYSKFTYFMLHGEKMDITAKSDTTVQLFEQELPKETLRQRYLFLESDDYMGMAGAFRDYLMRHNELLADKVSNAEVPSVVEYIGAVDNTEHMLGYPVTRPQPLTKFADAKRMTEELVAGGLENFAIKYSGWANKGLKHSNMKKVKPVSRLGSEKELKDLVGYTKSQGVELYLDGEFSFVYKDGLFDGFVQNRDVGKRVSRKLSKLYPFWYVWYGPFEDKKELHYFVKPSYMLDSVDAYAKKVGGYGVDNISFSDVGYILGADYNPKSLVTREAVMNGQVDKLAELKSANKKVMISSDNLYAMPYADFALGMRLNYSSKNIVDETVPFYSTVFHGLVPFAGAPLNTSSDPERELLKAIENGAGMYYIFMNEPSIVLQRERFTEYYASDFSMWKDTVHENHQTFKEALDGTYDQFITDHQKVADGVYLTEYENGRKVIVNYNTFDYTYGGKTIASMGFIVEGGGSNE